MHCHIESQILNVSPFDEVVARMMSLVEQITRLGINLEFIDLGGGLGISSQKETKAHEPADLADTILPIFGERSRLSESRRDSCLNPEDTSLATQESLLQALTR